MRWHLGRFLPVEQRPARPMTGVNVRRWFSAAAAPYVVIALALTFTSTTLAIGFSVDEYFQRVALQENPPLAGVGRAPWELYTFSTPANNAALVEEGIFPWWTDREFLVAFFRPVSSLSLWFDHTLLGDNTVLMHLHSMFWFAVLLWVVFSVYRAFSSSPQLPALALFLYALDDARAQTVGWISLRNALLALTPAFLALLFHHRYRQGAGRKFGLLAPAMFALSLLCGEVAISVCGYLFAYAVFLDRGSFWARARTLAPYALLLIPYRIVYNALGYGALHSAMYIDPMREPWAFVEALVTHLPVLLFAQFTLPPAEFWEAYPLMAPWLQPAVFVLLLLGLFTLYRLLRPIFARSREARFWALGGILAAIPVCGTFPADRLLVATSLGGAALLSDLLLHLIEERGAAHALFRRVVLVALIGVHFVFGPLFLTVRAQDIELTKDLLEYADRSIDQGPALRDKTLVMINPPLNALGLYFPVYRAATGRTLPHRFRYLATAESALRVERVDARTLRLRPEGGFLFSASQRVLRSHGDSLHVGDVVALSDMRFEVTASTPDGRPAEVTVRFDKDLEDPSFEWVKWGTLDYVPFHVPRIGESEVLPKVDALPLLFEVPGT